MQTHISEEISLFPEAWIKFKNIVTMLINKEKKKRVYLLDKYYVSNLYLLLTETWHMQVVWV